MANSDYKEPRANSQASSSSEDDKTPEPKTAGQASEPLSRHPKASQEASAKTPTDRPKLEDFELLKLLGKGSFGKVLLVRKNDEPEQLYAMKVLKKTEVSEAKQRLHTLTERNILATVKHPNVVRLKCSFQTKQRLYLVLEYCPGGELFFNLQESGRFGERKARFYAANVALALEHFHSRGIIYRE